MELNETAKIIALITTNYSEGLLPAGWISNPQSTTRAWHTLLEDLKYSDVQKAVVKHMMTEKFPPTIAHIRGIIADSYMVNKQSPEEAWGQIMYSVRKFGHVDKEGALSSLPETARKIVERFGWDYFCQMPIDEVSTYYAQFRNSYSAIVLKEKEILQVPEQFRQISNNQKLIEEIEGGKNNDKGNRSNQSR